MIDSKASKFFVELEQQYHNGEQSRDEQKKKEELLKKTMQQHLKDLTHRDYKQAMLDQMEKYERNAHNCHVTVLMFLPSECAVERIRSADSSFEEKAWQSHIIPVGPSGLVNALSQSRMMIAGAKQEENTQKIIAEVKKLLVSIGRMYDLSDSLGKSIKSSFEKYDKFAASFNSNFLVKARNLNSYGIEHAQQQGLTKLNRYQVITTADIIDAQALEEDDADNEVQSSLALAND